MGWHLAHRGATLGHFTKLCSEHRLDEALKTAYLLDEHGVPLSNDILYCLLQGCTKKKDLVSGRRVHSLMITSGLDSFPCLADHLIRLFTSCGSLLEANQVFCRVSKPSVYTWNGIITAHTKLCEDLRALELYTEMEGGGVKPDKVTFLCLLKACSSTGASRQGKLIHERVIQSGVESDVVVQNTLVNMYAKCGSLEEASRMFIGLQKRDIVSWGAMIVGYAKHGHGLAALDLFKKMHQDGSKPNEVTFLCVLKACASAGAVEQGRLLHDQIVVAGFEADIVFANTLIDMYAKCGKLEEAWKVFNDLSRRDVVSWAAMIAGYAQHGHSPHALELFEQMQQENIKPNEVLFVSILKACGSVKGIVQGRRIHDRIIRTGMKLDVIVGNTLIDLYVKCEFLMDAQKVFDKLLIKDVVSWGAMIGGYAQYGQFEAVLHLFDKMQLEGILPDNDMLPCLLKACCSTRAVGLGRLIHDQIVRCGFKSDEVIGSTLVDTYAKCGCLEEARKVFDDLPKRDAVSWGAIIAGYAQHGHGAPAFQLFKEMQQKGIKPSKVTFLCILKACDSIGAIMQGRLIHDQVTRNGEASDVVIGSTLVDMYAKCGNIEDARSVFDNLHSRDAVSWSAMIVGYAMYGCGLRALELFEKMQQEGVKPSKVTYLCVLKACNGIGGVWHGRLIHDQILQSGFGSDANIENTLLDMYAKCGSLDEARKVFDTLPNQDGVAWGAMIAGYALHGQFILAEQCLEDMQQQGQKPGDLIFTSMLTACSRAGLVDEGYQYFRSMKEDYGITPSLEHYSCIVDLLGHAGRLSEAEHFLQSMPVEPDTIIWRSLLTSCKAYGNIMLGRHCFDQLLELDPIDASTYTLMASIYADAYMWDDFNKVQEMRRCAGACKKPGRAWIEGNDDEVHEFIVADKTHPCSDKIYPKLERLKILLKEEGFVALVESVSEPMLDDANVDAVFKHCEREAVGFGFSCIPEGTTTHATNVFQICTECQLAGKSMSKLDRPDIILKDTYCFHHLNGEACLCGQFSCHVQ